jgi:predicted RNase H-like HicB family nuclease
MVVHRQVLEAAQRLCAARAKPTFTPDEIVRALPHVNAQTVRTHVTSRCCVNARAHHGSRLAYFRRIGRGQYELLAAHRKSRQVATTRRQTTRSDSPGQRDAIHAIVTRDQDAYVVECHEIAVVTQGGTLDQALANLLEAVGLHLEGEDLKALGLGRLERIHVTYDLPADVSAA